MGVKDLSLIIRRTTTAVKPIHSLSTLRGKRLAIDGNLQAMKFYFGSSKPRSDGTLPNPRAHLKHWNSFIGALRRFDISPVVVFDGASRIPAKAKENQRRQNARELQVLRAKAEGIRGERLVALKGVWDSMGKEERNAIRRAWGTTTKQEGQITSLPLEPPPQSDQVQETTAERLHALYALMRTDTSNPLYSKNQVLVSMEEAAFFATFLAEEEDSPTAESEAEEVVLDEEELPGGNVLSALVEKSGKLEASHGRRGKGVPKTVFKEALMLLKALGVPTILPAREEPFEAEAICSSLYHARLVDYVVSEDTDVMAYSAPLLRKITITSSSKSHTKGMNVIDAVKLRKELRLSTREEWVDFCLLCGTDFNDRIPGVGPSTALALIQEHKSIENVLASQVKYQPLDPVAYLDTIHIARQVFLNLPPIPEGFSLAPTVVDEQERRKVLIELGVMRGRREERGRLASQQKLVDTPSGDEMGKLYDWSLADELDDSEVDVFRRGDGLTWREGEVNFEDVGVMDLAERFADVNVDEEGDVEIDRFSV